MSSFQLNYSNLIIRRATVPEIRKIFIPQLFVVVFLLIIWAPLIIRYSHESLTIFVLILVFAYIIGVCARVFPIKPKNLHIWFAIYNDEVIGIANISKQNSYSILEKLHINYYYHRKGVGALLVKTLASEEIKPLYVLPVDAIGFYKKLGFTPVNNTGLPQLIRIRNLFSKHMVLR